LYWLIPAPGTTIVIIMSHQTCQCHHSSFSRLVHLVLLLGWLLSTNGIAPACVLAAAIVDGNHNVKVGAHANGEVVVLLTHAQPVNSDQTHAHGALCQLIIAFAEATPSDTDDHVISFEQLESASSPLRRPFADIRVWAVVAQAGQSLFQIKEWCPDPVISWTTKSITWSPGLELKAGKTIMLC
jgi:hypothetical protein